MEEDPTDADGAAGSDAPADGAPPVDEVPEAPDRSVPRSAPAAPRAGPGPGRRAPQASRSDYRGCALWAGGFLVLVVISFAVGVILRPDSDTTDGSEAVTLAGAVAGDDAYAIVGRTDEVGDPCVTLRRDDEEVTGQCGFAPSGDGAGRYTVTSSTLDDGTTVVFAPVPQQAEQVRITLTDDTEAVVDVRRSESAGFPWFEYETDQDVDGPVDVLDGNGDPIQPG